LKKFFYWLVSVIGLISLLAISLIGPVDDSPLEQKQFYENTLRRLDTWKPKVNRPTKSLNVGWSKINITPKSPMPMAGYTPRDHFDSVHDSIYIRVLAIDNGSVSCFVISADLLIFPPALKDKILGEKNDGRFLYFTATHAHSSLGAWDNSIIGNLILGNYNERWLDSLTKKIYSAMDLALAEQRPAKINYFEVDASEYVENRLNPETGKVDGRLRGIEISRNDGSKGLLLSYSAHPTNISHLSLVLSGDYPASLVRVAEHDGFDFAMFASSTIGSHRVKGIPETEFAMCDSLAGRLFKKVHAAETVPINDSTISTSTIQVDYGPSQLHILQGYKVRDWAFKLLFRKLRGDLRYLKVGKIIFLGTPCDFSGEIYTRDHLGQIAESQNEKLFITSFNGDYVGYITYDDHYGKSEQEEVMAMNWVGPHFGNYYSKIVKKIIERSK
jgi:neutral ceramidase